MRIFVRKRQSSLPGAAIAFSLRALVRLRCRSDAQHADQAVEADQQNERDDSAHAKRSDQEPHGFAVRRVDGATTKTN